MDLAPVRVRHFQHSTSKTVYGRAAVGKSSEQIVACAGVPSMHVTSDDLTIFRYYKEASLLEESSTTSKGSPAGIRHGCWATLLIENDRITGVEFRTRAGRNRTVQR